MRAQNRGLSLVERTGIKKYKASAFRSENSLIPLISDGNLYNQTAISRIRLQSPKSDFNLHNQAAISTSNMIIFLHIFPVSKYQNITIHSFATYKDIRVSQIIFLQIIKVSELPVLLNIKMLEYHC